MTIYIGTSGYSYREWKGSFYPRDLPAKSMLRYYGEQFTTVEANSTFQRIPDESVVKSWEQQVPARFKFALKAPQRITHFRRLKGVKGPLSVFLAFAGKLKKRCGPLLFQLPPNFKKDTARLRAFLALVPARVRVALEFRHPTWFDDEILGLLRRHRAALCIADADDFEVPFVATTNWGYMRLRRSNYSRANLRAWAKRIQKQDWRDAFIYFRHEETGKGPRFAKQLDLIMSA
jgi:uncharacterized protein YecE (DUF72 family)